MLRRAEVCCVSRCARRCARRCVEVCRGVLWCAEVLYIYMDISSYLMLSIKVKLSKHSINSNMFSCFKLLVKTAHSLTLWRIKLTTRNQNTNCPSLNILIIWFNLINLKVIFHYFASSENIWISPAILCWAWNIN